MSPYASNYFVQKYVDVNVSLPALHYQNNGKYVILYAFYKNSVSLWIIMNV